ncbi:hypothetical protein [Ferrimonas senticii]|uniref:hypothetical protein n=1 Tax=Ferrimonas senticii TaxID=394566 RepID=UPI000404090C|nr:hypothetical protein [Ferrimonas senticii]
MSFVAFNYDFKIGRKQHTGEFQTVTGMYAGGSIETTTTTENGTTSTRHNTTINVRTVDGKVKSVVKSGKINIPGSSAVTIFYYPKGSYLYPYDVYIHDTEKLYSLGKAEQKGARRALSGWNPLQRLWGRLIDAVYIVSMFALALLAFGWSERVMRFEDLYCFLIAGAAFFASAYALVIPARWLGGTFSYYGMLEAELNKLGFARAAEIDRQLNQGRNQVDDVDHGAGMSFADGTVLSATSSGQSESADFKPMF